MILEFCKKFPSFIPISYPYEVILKDCPSLWHQFYHCCNYTLSFIPKMSGLSKLIAIIFMTLKNFMKVFISLRALKRL
ncbi:acylphosphatase [Helicobacter pylori]|nr:acylphosphatase [Helicobacter pylori]